MLLVALKASSYFPTRFSARSAVDPAVTVENERETEKKEKERKLDDRLTYCEGHGGDTADHDDNGRCHPPGNFPGAAGSDSSARRRDNNLIVGGGEEA
jgi:hypothetical protein